jgi:hypothetical protein
MASGRVLDAKQFLGGSDNVLNLELLPEQTRSFSYDFNADVSSYTFSAEYSTVLVDTLTYSVSDGTPNYASSTVTGYFANIDGAGNSVGTVASDHIDDSDAANGIVVFTIPKDRYANDGYITPSARTNVVLTILEFKWTNTATTPNTVDSHRFTIVERYSPDRTPGDPSAVGNPAEFTTIS